MAQTRLDELDEISGLTWQPGPSTQDRRQYFAFRWPMVFSITAARTDDEWVCDLNVNAAPPNVSGSTAGMPVEVLGTALQFADLLHCTYVQWRGDCPLCNPDVCGRTVLEMPPQLPPALESPGPIREFHGPNLQHWRTQQELTQTELGRRVGVSARQIRYWESGEREPRFGEINALATVLRVPQTAFAALDVEG